MTSTGTYAQTGPIITITAAHRLIAGQATTLDFSNPAPGTPSATSGNYSVSGSFPVDATHFTVRTKDILGATYTQPVGSNIVTVTTVNVVSSGSPSATNHGLVDGDSVFIKFTSGSPSAPPDGVYFVNTNSTTLFDITVPDAVARTGNATTSSLKGGYTVSANSTTATFTCATIHGLATGTSVQISMVGSNGQAKPTANDSFPITVVDSTRFTITLPVAPTSSRNGTFTAGCSELGANFNRSGDVSSGLNSWSVGTTDTDIGQTPMRAPTVFNFYTPDYQFPGAVATAGLTTPEFQITTETNIIRQANFFFGGIFSSSSSTSSGATNGLNSFKNGGGAIAFDLSPWMANGPGGVPWTNDVNLDALISQLNTLLMAGQMTTGMRAVISNYVLLMNAAHTSYTNITYSNTSPTDTHKRDRIRAIVHLIVTSPEYGIQK